MTPPPAPPRTLAATAVHDAQVRVSAAARGAQLALIAVGGAVRAADLHALREPRAVGHALAPRATPQHATRLARAALHAIAGVCGHKTCTHGSCRPGRGPGWSSAAPRVGALSQRLAEFPPTIWGLVGALISTRGSGGPQPSVRPCSPISQLRKQVQLGETSYCSPTLTFKALFTVSSQPPFYRWGN